MDFIRTEIALSGIIYCSCISEVKDLLIKQVSNTVRFEESIRNMIDKGVTTFVEIGPGKVLNGFVKKINKEVKILNIENIESLNNTIKELGE